MDNILRVPAHSVNYGDMIVDENMNGEIVEVGMVNDVDQQPGLVTITLESMEKMNYYEGDTVTIQEG